MKRIAVILIVVFMLIDSLNAQIHLFLQEQGVNLAEGKSSA